MNLSRILLVALIAFIAPMAEAGPGLVGNGGDAVRCQPVAANAFSGIYMLDFLLTFQTINQNADVVPVFSWDESLERLRRILLAKNADLAASFEQYIRDFDNHNDFTRPRIWREAGFGLVNIDDERIIRKLPPNCYKLNGDQSIDIIQTVVQTQRPDIFIFEYDPAVFDEFLHFAPLQFSFLVVHEWLWSLTDDVRIIRDVNRFLHSQAAGQLQPEDFGRAIANMGIALRPTVSVPVCDRSEAVRNAISTALHRSCGDIANVDRVARLTITGPKIEELRLSDLSGLRHVATFRASGLGLRFLYKNQFADMPDASSYDLTRNQLKELPPAFLVGHVVDSMLDPDGVIAGYDDVLFGHNDIASLPVLDGLEAPVFGINVLDLGYNKLTSVPVRLCDFMRDHYDDTDNSDDRDEYRGEIILTGNPIPAAAIAALRHACPDKKITF